MSRQSIVLLMIAMTAIGCARGIGARNLPIDRQAYDEALSNSWKDQLLYNIVKIHYADAPTFLDVNSISQGYTLTFGGSAGYTLGWQFNQAGPSVLTTKAPNGETIASTQPAFTIPSNTLNLNGNFSRASNPTITYSPMSGDVIKKCIISPLQLDDLLRSLQNSWDARIVIPYCVAAINNQRNDVWAINAEFGDLAIKWRDLTVSNVIHIAFLKPDNTTTNDGTQTKAKDKNASISTKPKPDKKAKEDGAQTNDKDKMASIATKPKDKWEELAVNLTAFTSNLVKKQKDNSTDDVKKTEVPYLIIDKPYDPLLPVFLKELFKVKKLGFKLEEGLKFKIISGSPPASSENQDEIQTIYIQPRSLMEVLLVLSGFIKEPDAQKSWVVQPEIPWFTNSNIPSLVVSRHEGPSLPGVLGKPDEFAAVNYKGYWYYVPDSEFKSKEILSYMMGIFTMIETGPKQTTPVLTLPVR
jgi:hypothetical protein